MRLFRRVTDIISANLNDLIDRFEDPEAMLRQAIREMESAIDATTNSAARAIAGERLLTRQLAAQRAQVERHGRRAAEAVRAADDSAARAALLAKLEAEKLTAAIEDELEVCTAAGRKLRRQVEAMRIRLGEARRKLLMLSARQQAAAARKRLVRELADARDVETAFGRFDRLTERVERSEAEADALLELSGFSDDRFDGTDQPDELQERVECELEKLKRESATN